MLLVDAGMSAALTQATRLERTPDCHLCQEALDLRAFMCATVEFSWRLPPQAHQHHPRTVADQGCAEVDSANAQHSGWLLSRHLPADDQAQVLRQLVVVQDAARRACTLLLFTQLAEHSIHVVARSGAIHRVVF